MLKQDGVQTTNGNESVKDDYLGVYHHLFYYLKTEVDHLQCHNQIRLHIKWFLLNFKNFQFVLKKISIIFR